MAIGGDLPHHRQLLRSRAINLGEPHSPECARTAARIRRRFWPDPSFALCPSFFLPPAKRFINNVVEWIEGWIVSLSNRQLEVYFCNVTSLRASNEPWNLHGRRVEIFFQLFDDIAGFFKLFSGFFKLFSRKKLVFRLVDKSSAK